jgi:hypothetical protein
MNDFITRFHAQAHGREILSAEQQLRIAVNLLREASRLLTENAELECQLVDMKLELADMKLDLEESRAKYHELLYAVGKKYPGELRHETALRYIRQAERPADDAAKSADSCQE